MRSIVKLVVTALLLSTLAVRASIAAQTVAQHLQDISVTVDAPGSWASGIIITRTNRIGEAVNFVLTAGHVITNVRRSTSVNVTNTVVVFSDVNVVKTIVENGRCVGQISYAAKVVRYSDEDFGDDIALLEVYHRNFSQACTHFTTNLAPVEIGTLLLHVGSFKGIVGAGSMSAGIQSQIGRITASVVFDQTTAAAYPGSSGGGVFTEDGRCVGLILRQRGEAFNLYVPYRRIVRWAVRSNLKWVIDESLPLPSDEERSKLSIDEEGKPPVHHDSTTTVPAWIVSPFR